MRTQQRQQRVDWGHIVDVCSQGISHMHYVKAPEAAVTGLVTTRRLARVAGKRRLDDWSEDEQAFIESAHKTACVIERQALSGGHDTEYQEVCYQLANRLDAIVTEVETIRAQGWVKYGTQTQFARTDYRLF